MLINDFKPKRSIPINCQATNSLLIKIIVWILLIHCSTVQMISYCNYKQNVRIASNFITNEFCSFITYKTIFNNISFYIYNSINIVVFLGKNIYKKLSFSILFIGNILRHLWNIVDIKFGFHMIAMIDLQPFSIFYSVYLDLQLILMVGRYHEQIQLYSSPNWKKNFENVHNNIIWNEFITKNQPISPIFIFRRKRT